MRLGDQQGQHRETVGQQTLVSLKQAELANLVTFYKTLGGGWREKTEQQAALP